MKCVNFPLNASELNKVVELFFLEYEFAVRTDVVSGIVLYFRFILLFRSQGVKWLWLLRIICETKTQFLLFTFGIQIY